MTIKALVNPAHGPGSTCLAFSPDGSCVYTGGADTLVRIWDAELGEDQEPPCVTEANEEVTSVAASTNCWLSASKDSDVRQYEAGKDSLRALVASAAGVPIRCVAVDPKGKRVAITSDEPVVKVIDLEDITRMVTLQGHSKAVRKATWHPSGALLTTCGADGKIIVWEVSEDEPKQEKVIEGLLPVVSDTDEFGYDCSTVWHTSGQYFFVAMRTHEIATISRTDWSKSSTLSDDACTGDITALALSKNGDLLAWTDAAGDLTRWPEPIPSSAPDPVKLSAGTHSVTVPVKRKGTPTLFDNDNVVLARSEKDKASGDADDLLGIDLDNDDWILDDLGGGMDDDGEAKRLAAEGGVKEMVSVTRAQSAFQPGSTPMENTKRYLAYNTIGVIEVTDQDTHYIVNVEFHDRSARKSYHFTDHFRYDLASLGERGALYACQPEAEHAAHVIYKPYGTWGAQGDWTYELPSGTRVLGVTAGGPPPTKSLRERRDVDIEGLGNVVIATSDGELVFLTGSGIERACLSLPGDFVVMVAGGEWVFVVTRDGSTTMDGSQNLTGRLIKFDDFCILQKEALPKRHIVKWIGITEEGAPAMYDSSGILHVMPCFRIPLSATWMRILDTNKLERREGKHESYWPVGVAGEAFMCLILKGRQEHPGFPHPLIQELPIRLPFKPTDPKEAPLEEHFARETLLLDILRDNLGDELTSDELGTWELALDKELIQLIQNACKTDRLARALDLARLLHLTSSFDIAVKVAAFYHLLSLQEKLEVLRADRLDDTASTPPDDFTSVPAPHLPAVNAGAASRPKAFQDFRPPPALHRPGLECATPSAESSSTVVTQAGYTDTQMTDDSTVFGGGGSSFADDTQMDDFSYASPEGKRKRPLDEDAPRASSPGAKRRALGESVSTWFMRSNPFARKPGADANGRNPFARSVDTNKAVHESDSFFTKVDAAENDKGKRNAQGKAKPKEKENKETGRQTTLFGLPPAQPAEKKPPGRPKKKAGTPAEDSQESTAATLQESQVDESQEGGDTQVDEPSQVPTEIEMQEVDVNAMETEDLESPIEWPPSPEPRKRELGATA
ncbi:hypothetical protein C8Q78DRAFT_1118280 [Trametes maxima]|nr:hypothetical protein C8Q78DRAFT_1118280 [Trametes maxima]